jgi:hypothetical protein
MSMCLFRYYRVELRRRLDDAAIARARAVGAGLSLEAALAAELGV